MSIFTIQDEIRKEADSSATKRWLAVDPWRSCRALIFDWLLIVGALLICSRLQTWWMFLLCAIFIGLRQYALFILGHDAIHGSLHPVHKVNDTISTWFIHGPMFMGFADGRRNHLEHHKMLGCREDPDRYLHVLSNKSTPLQFLLFCSGLATFASTVLKVTPFGKLACARGADQSISTSVKSVLGCYLVDRIPVLIDQVLILSGFWLLGLPLWSYPILWIAPIYFCVFLPDEIRAFSEHAWLTLCDDEVDEKRLITFRPSFWEAAYFSPHNMNYHAEHHLWPRVPYYNLPKVYDGIKHRPELTVRSSYLAFLQAVLVYLSKIQTEVNPKVT